MRLSAPAAAAVAVLAARVSAENYLGFNSGATLADNSAKFKADWVKEFTTAQKLENSPGIFNSVRLYTNIQAYSKSDPIEAFRAALETKTKMLLGIWASGTDSIENEIKALRAALDADGKEFADLVIGISIGSEDLYRNSVTGVQNEAGIGADPDVLVRFIKEFRSAFADTLLSDKPVGHVDTWDVWGNSSNKAVVDAIDFVGVDEYPYYENGKGNSIENSGQLFDRAYQATVAAANGKPVWVTETGWPYTGPDWDLAVPSIENAKYYWDEVGCRVLFGKTPTFWYTLRDSNPANKMKFAITKDLSTEPLFDLKCPTTFRTPNTTDSDGPSTTSSADSPASTVSRTPSSSGSPQDDTPAEGGVDGGDGGDGGSAAASLSKLSSLAVAGVALVAGAVHMLL